VVDVPRVTVHVELLTRFGAGRDLTFLRRDEEGAVLSVLVERAIDVVRIPPLLV
jgi:hypothetical protein